MIFGVEFKSCQGGKQQRRARGEKVEENFLFWTPGPTEALCSGIYSTALQYMSNKLNIFHNSLNIDDWLFYTNVSDPQVFGQKSNFTLPES